MSDWRCEAICFELHVLYLLTVRACLLRLQHYFFNEIVQIMNVHYMCLQLLCSMQHTPFFLGNDTLTHVSGHKTEEMPNDLLGKLDYLIELQVFIASKLRYFVYKICLFIYIPNLEKKYRSQQPGSP